MRIERVAMLAALLAVAGCVTTHDGNTLTPSGNMPHASKKDEAQDAARIHTELGQQYLANGDLQTALEKLTKALQFDPDYAPAHTVIAVVYERINHLPEAEGHYRKAVALEPTKGGPNNNLGAFLCKVGKYAEGESYFARAVADPFYRTPDVAWTNDGVCRLRAGDKAGAEASFRKAVDANPQNGEALLQLANLLYLNNDAFRARAFLQRFDALGQPSAVSLKLGHDIETRLGNKDAALNYGKRLQSQFPDSEQARALDATASQ
ncbi:type IV pilus biogenesis/stability protein PilW [Fulvimonas soli]|jgi:type IV pilus assembly protein PilF|uniref:Type IV pilus assembly protein PilF n=1 Tax=Fulvimonas soli TaxID=155197 RepID=A0A316IRE8_9GAMM|nr:type IV pilus biogenesis/stability protein PilW [Fulvimonas soli]PWK89681.1 type IV pilus assembly protein PilF [Fulvimonas soli]TNY27667.1 type IV pilus biogenesis/stability protein PilW [Fulvimonas soli]